MERVLRWIWRLYPPAFRRRFVPEMERDLELRIEAGRGVGVGLVAEALLTLVRAWTRFIVRPVTLEGLVTDLAVALRSLRRAPGYAVAVVSILALALGANTAVFSVTHAVLLRALPYGAPERVYRIQPAPIGNVSPDRGWDVAPEVTALPHVEAAALYIENGGANLTTANATERISVTQVSDDFFGVLQVEPLLGPGLANVERADVVVLSYDLWRRRFGARQDVLGTRIELNDEPYEVVGVMPDDVAFPSAVDLWLPFPADPAFYSGAYGPTGFALLRAGADLEGLRSALQQGVDQRYASASIDPPPVTLTPLHEALTGSVRTPLYILLCIAGLVVLLGCLNLAGLVLSRTAQRMSELTIRRALGAARSRLFRHLAAEVLLLAAAAAVVGLGAASLTTGLLTTMLPAETPGLAEAGLDAPVLIFAAALAVVAGLLVGGLPSLYGAWADERPHVSRTATSSPLRGHVQSVLVSAQVAVAAVLVTGAALLGRSLTNLQAVPLGYDLEQVLTFRVSLPPETYGDSSARRAYLANALDGLQGIPGVEAAGATTLLPRQEGWAIGFRLVPEGVAEEDVPWATWIQVTPDYFDAMGIRTVAGRAFAEPGLGPYDQVAISETLARTLYGEAHATGAPADLHVGRDAVPTVVAAVMDGVHMRTRQATPPEVVYTLLDESRYLSFALRADGDPLLFAERVREVMRTTDPSVPVFDLTTTGRAAAQEIATERAVALLSRLFSACALILAAVGLYGLVSQALTRRRRELGIRLVMGARPRSLVRAAMGRPIGLALAGLAAGLLVSLWASRFLAPLLFEVPTRDPSALAVVCATIIGTTALAAYLPARRAARVDPGESLRAE